jgi:hypothetical protein
MVPGNNIKTLGAMTVVGIVLVLALVVSISNIINRDFKK